MFGRLYTASKSWVKNHGHLLPRDLHRIYIERHEAIRPSDGVDYKFSLRSVEVYLWIRNLFEQHLANGEDVLLIGL